MQFFAERTFCLIISIAGIHMISSKSIIISFPLNGVKYVALNHYPVSRFRFPGNQQPLVSGTPSCLREIISSASGVTLIVQR